MNLNDLILKIKGGSGSGNFGHKGRLGKRGGSMTSSFSSEHVEIDSKGLEDKFVKMYKGRYQKISNAETMALKHYTWFSKRINSDLRSGNKLEDIDAKTVKALDTATKKFSFDKNYDLYQGLGSDVIERLKTGKTVVNKGFTSTTTKPTLAANFGTVVRLRFKTKPKFVPGDYTEQELIMKRGLKFKFNGYDEDGTMIVDVE